MSRNCNLNLIDVMKNKKAETLNRSLRETQLMKAMENIYCIHKGMLYYNYYGCIHCRKMIPEIAELFNRKVKHKDYYGPLLYEFELAAINRYILGEEFRLDSGRVSMEIRCYGEVGYAYGKDPIIFGNRKSEIVALML